MNSASPQGSLHPAEAQHSVSTRLELEERSRLALEAAGIGTWSWEIAPDRVIWDENTYRLLGVPDGQFSGLGADMQLLIHQDDRKRVSIAVTECLAGEHDMDIEYRVVWPEDGSIHFLRVRGKVVRDENGRGIRMMGACWEITERKAIEEDLARERFFLQTLMEHIPDKIYFKDIGSRFIWASRETLVRFNTTDPEDVLGKTDFDFFKDEHARAAFDNEQEIIRTGQPLVNVEERETWADGHETWVSTTKMPLIDPEGRIIGTFGLSRDITDKKRSEEQLGKYAQELRRRNEELEEDMEMARELQNALMPRRYPCFPHSALPIDSAIHFSHFFNPSTAVSGDFFDILELSDTTAGIFICDVMGHGVRAALVAAIIRALIGELKSSAETPGVFLDKLNRKLADILKQTDIPMFASASYVVADLANGELRYANAGHPDPLWVRHEIGDAQTSQLNHCKRGPVLGMFEKAEYGTSHIPLAAHDKVFLFTDGLFEVEGVDGELYDEKSLMRAVSRRVNLTAGDLCREVLAEIRQFSANKEFSDDVCLVALEVERIIGRS